MTIDLFHGLAPQDADTLVSLGRRVPLAAGALLFSLGDPADAVYAVERGRIALTLPIRVHDREQDLLVEERVGGETLGWSALVPPHRFTLTATALVDSDLIAFSRDVLVAHFEARPDTGLALTRNLASVIGHRLQVVQAMWLREMQRLAQMRAAAGAPA